MGDIIPAPLSLPSRTGDFCLTFRPLCLDRRPAPKRRRNGDDQRNNQSQHVTRDLGDERYAVHEDITQPNIDGVTHMVSPSTSQIVKRAQESPVEPARNLPMGLAARRPMSKETRPNLPSIHERAGMVQHRPTRRGACQSFGQSKSSGATDEVAGLIPCHGANISSQANAPECQIACSDKCATGQHLQRCGDWQSQTR